MDAIDFNTFNESSLPLDIATTTTENNNNKIESQSPALMHHQTKLDIFIIRGFNLLANGAIINTNTLQSVNNSPQTTTATPSVSSSTTINNNNNNNNNNNAPTPLNESDPSKPQDEKAALATSKENEGSPSAMKTIQSPSQYSQIFITLSKVYTAVLATGSIDDKSTSPKSAIELYQRFQQIMKELELSYEVSPYSKYFIRVNEGMWQIKPDSELSDDNLWQLVSMSIFAVYQPQTGTVMNPNPNLNQNRINKNTVSSNSSPNDPLNTRSTSIEKNGTPPNKPKRAPVARGKRKTTKVTKRLTKKKQQAAAANAAAAAATAGNLTIDNSSLPQQLQKRLENISQDINSRSLNGYYTQPTSPGASAFEFGLMDSDIYPVFNSTTTLPTTTSTSWKRRSLGSLDVNTLDDDAVEELLQLPNSNKRSKTNPTANGSDVVNNQSLNNNNNNNTNNNNNMNNNNNNNSSSNGATNTLGMNTNENLVSNINVNSSMTSSNNDINFLMETMIRQLKGTYGNVINEKDQRITQLERELELQRQETQWLRKMLIEDMGCVRSLLKDIRK
ncbi:hypothetical protein NCAS_0G01640 [Naumovozyma castellii]|uniref:Transcription factor n=1 Tax=Naumovozyma castellii TaxID=27288 RepID=G0VI17_NAUCA|nr:hypothetical protein NCAS_0G01640 [Naumovozyma castellii CBS 4309]CCC71051.1 hypothetical protein NCAS_0G01640 [Naumovozyma castellii CBS 4309]